VFYVLRKKLKNFDVYVFKCFNKLDKMLGWSPGVIMNMKDHI